MSTLNKRNTRYALYPASDPDAPIWAIDDNGGCELHHLPDDELIEAILVRADRKRAEREQQEADERARREAADAKRAREFRVLEFRKP